MLKSHIVQVAQASGLLFWASRPKPSGDMDWLWFVRTTSGGRWLTKSGATPDLTGATPVPPFQNVVWVAQASGLLFWASRPKPSGDVDWLWFVRTTSGGRCLTKSGVTPDLTGATPVPPKNDLSIGNVVMATSAKQSDREQFQAAKSPARTTQTTGTTRRIGRIC